jgi:hypothetical protein
MVPMVVLDCGQKRLRFVHFRDDPAKYDGRLAISATSMAGADSAGINCEPDGSKSDVF